MQALKAQSQTSSELAAQFNRSDRHIRRTIADLILENKVIRTRDGRDFLYSLAAAVVEEAASSSTTTITGSAGTADNRGHNVRDRDLGHPSNTGERIADNRGHDCGHAKPKNSKQRYRNRKKEALSRPDPQFHQQNGPGDYHCNDSGTPLCPLSYAEFERDMIQFVLLDKKFRDLLITRASTDDWETRHIRGLIWIYPVAHLVLQVGQHTVTFYSDEPKDLSWIAAWARETFATDYGDIDSLVARIKHPENLSSEELTVVIKHQATIAGVRSQVQMYQHHGVYSLPSPNENTPGLKIYEFNGTMRVEFIIHGNTQGIAAVNMRAQLINIMPRIHHTHGVFWEFIQKYYSHALHPTMVDVGGHDFLQALEHISGQFTSTLNKLADRIPAAPTQEHLKLMELKAAIEALESSELGDIIRTFRDILNVEEAPTKVFLAAWTVWAKRNFKGRVIKADVASLLLRANEPLSATDIADAIAQLKAARLLQEDERLEICFSPEGAEMARILMAKREGVQ